MKPLYREPIVWVLVGIVVLSALLTAARMTLWAALP